MRAREPDSQGHVVSCGQRLHYEVHGEGLPTLLLMPTWTIINSRFWKGQVPYLARHFRVVTFDGPGNGPSDRPLEPAPYAVEAVSAAAVEVMNATDTDAAVLVSLSQGAQWSLHLCAHAPDRVLGSVFVGPALPLAPPHEARKRIPEQFDRPYTTTEGWAKYNRYYWQDHYEDFLWYFFGQVFTEAHSTKQIEDAVGWGLETTPQVLLTGRRNPPPDEETVRRWCGRVRCPVMVIHGSDDAVVPWAVGEELAAATGGELVTLGGSGHGPMARDPVKVNRLIRDFVERLGPVAGPTSSSASDPSPIASEPDPKASARTWQRALTRPRRALFISSPIGLGHVQRDLAIARELRARVQGLEIHWWTQHPATRVLEVAGEYVHPLCSRLASESSHWEQESAGHELHAFYAFRRMDEILLANFMLFHDLTREEQYDLWIGDESWEVDYFLHENPELKAAPYVFLTDVIGFLPVEDGDLREAELTRDYNAEMIEQRARYPRLRDLSLYIGNYEDLPEQSFGADLPAIRDWTREWFEEVGYVLPFDPLDFRDTAGQRRRLGYPEEGPLLFAAVGGTSIGRSLLHRCADAFALLKDRYPQARMTMVTGPRIDPESLPEVDGLDKRAYVHDLFEHLACADAAVVQGGLSTTMELVGLGRPFLYFPLQKHWEQVHHVQQRLGRYGAGPGLDYSVTSAEELGERLAGLLREPARYRKVESGAASRAAERIAGLVG